jgi:hypothetical protein
MPIKVQCACGKAFAAKDELAGKTVKCPGCQKPLKIPGGQAAAAKEPAKAAAKTASAKPGAPKPPATKPTAGKSASASKPTAAPSSAAANADLFDEIGLQAAAAGTRPCPGCTEPLDLKAVVCIKCGFNTLLGRRMQTVKVGGEDEGPVGHGAVAHDLLGKAAKVIEEDQAEEVKKTKEGMPWWVYLIALLFLIGVATAMLMFWGKEEPKDDKKGLLHREATLLADCDFREASRNSPKFVAIPDSQAGTKT